MKSEIGPLKSGVEGSKLAHSKVKLAHSLAHSFGPLPYGETHSKLAHTIGPLIGPPLIRKEGLKKAIKPPIVPQTGDLSTQYLNKGKT